MAAKPGGLPEEGNGAANGAANDPQKAIASQINEELNNGQPKFVMGKYQMG
eukprot:CAMPEP_0115071328 /NCGR_PEP_ID=MMETSP0227-20121206/13608_1 /TAXON_ID=89957 /ORGANISM="Polarella glacialis, Strain CCMP 1383" /LENGTH=50 /DNA_ID=CAMNT_0002457941 /DNA_START=92 /DNA_END=240 /DNA_ORIENTATION=+